MPPNVPNPASAAARTGSGDSVCFGGEHFPDSAPAQKYQARILTQRLRLGPAPLFVRVLGGAPIVHVVDGGRA